MFYRWALAICTCCKKKQKKKKNTILFEETATVFEKRWTSSKMGVDFVGIIEGKKHSRNIEGERARER